LALGRKVFEDSFDAFRSTVVNEPRGGDVLVGALLVPPADPDRAAGVIFFTTSARWVFAVTARLDWPLRSAISGALAREYIGLSQRLRLRRQLSIRTDSLER
jgi:hypothetical protein